MGQGLSDQTIFDLFYKYRIVITKQKDVDIFTAISVSDVSEKSHLYKVFVCQH